jgi:hypothetical protein
MNFNDKNAVHAKAILLFCSLSMQFFKLISCHRYEYKYSNKYCHPNVLLLNCQNICNNHYEYILNHNLYICGISDKTRDLEVRVRIPVQVQIFLLKFM